MKAYTQQLWNEYFPILNLLTCMTLHVYRNFMQMNQINKSTFQNAFFSFEIGCVTSGFENIIILLLFFFFIFRNSRLNFYNIIQLVISVLRFFYVYSLKLRQPFRNFPFSWSGSTRNLYNCLMTKYNSLGIESLAKNYSADFAFHFVFSQD